MGMGPFMRTVAMACGEPPMPGLLLSRLIVVRDAARQQDQDLSFPATSAASLWSRAAIPAPCRRRATASTAPNLGLRQRPSRETVAERVGRVAAKI
ncbi:BgTH12-06954 [Blumeria graminis f. sp. triticale]|uniref:Bgt-1082 n=3 Tax=Blumeria graminis TaxID=34373 RepID=A0A381L2I4_BLUGR|nr:hypothetical protein BGT96224_1082 [Blumeria graminis f. sp. tritici 96224]CAD6506022.1 BgTH12-06954 [Blumeria graminis f. sp. triticale]VDB94663.1 Bgt-1082 [Blumeria graminis f. sp. tritici]